MFIKKLRALRKLLEEIADDVQFAQLDEHVQDVIEDLTYDIPIEMSVLQKKELKDAHNDVDGTGGDT